MDSVFLDQCSRYLHDTLVAEKRQKMEIEPAPVSLDVVGVSLALRQNFVFVHELLGDHVRTSCRCLSSPALCFAFKPEIPILGELLGLFEAVEGFVVSR